MWFYNALIKMAVDIVGHVRTQVGRPQKYREGWSSANKQICTSLMQCVLSKESYVWRTLWWQTILNTL